MTGLAFLLEDRRDITRERRLLDAPRRIGGDRGCRKKPS
jgi:hypothetical protein